MRSDEDKAFSAGVCIGFFIGGLVLYVAAVMFVKGDRAEAVQVGAAEYYLDAHNNKQFRWKGNQ